MSNTITAYFKGRIGVAESVYQNDYGIVMVFDSIDLPAHFDCYFSILNQEEAIPGVGADRMVAIPNSVLTNPGVVTIHIPMHTGENDSEVEYVVYFKVVGRARPVDDGTPVQMTAIEKAIALLQNPIINIEQIVNEALDFTGDTFAEMKQELQDDFDNYTETLEGDLATWKGGVESDIDDVESDFDNLQAQFDTAVAAVTTDTEVTNIRVGDDNVIYTTAGEAVRKQFSDVKKALTLIDNYVMPNTMLNFGNNRSALSDLAISSISRTKLVATSTSDAIAVYIPISLTANKTYLFYFDFSTTDGSNVNIRLYQNDKSTLIKAYSTSEELYTYTPASSSTIYLRLYFLNSGSTLTVEDSFVGLSAEYGNLIGKIGMPQFSESMQSLIGELTAQSDNQNDELNVLNSCVLPTNLIDFEGNESSLSGLAIQKISKTKLKASRPSNDASAVYWIPISVQSGDYKFRFTFTSADGGNLNIRLFDTDKSTELKNFATSNQVEVYTFTESKTVYIRLYFLTLNKVLDITDAIVAPSEMFNEYLYKKVGYSQLAEELSAFWTKINDSFNAASSYSASGVTNSKDGNEVSLTTTADSAYIIYDLVIADGKKYLLYYDVDGTYTGGNYSFQIRLFSTTFTSFVETVSQTSGASASGTVLINPASGAGGKFSINMPSVNGQSITGNLYLYDVTELSQEQIDSFEWENVGTSMVVFLGSSGGSSDDSWIGKKVVFYGDSITQGSYPEKVQAKLGFTLVKNAYGGSRFGYASSANAFSDDTRIAQLPTDADVVCIMGGTNDWQHTEIETGALAYDSGFDRTKFKGAVAYTIQKIQTRCPSAKLYLLTNIGGRGNADPTVIQPLPEVAPSGVGVGNTPLKVRNATIEVANDLNIPVIDTWSCGINGFNRSEYIADTVHPTTDGYILIAEYIVNALKNDAPW